MRRYGSGTLLSEGFSPGGRQVLPPRGVRQQRDTEPHANQLAFVTSFDQREAVLLPLAVEPLSEQFGVFPTPFIRRRGVHVRVQANQLVQVPRGFLPTRRSKFSRRRQPCHPLVMLPRFRIVDALCVTRTNGTGKPLSDICSQRP